MSDIYATETYDSENSVSDDIIKLIDVSIGDKEEDYACIFSINGKTVVVDKKESVTVDGITIYVQDVYSANTGSQDKDKCKFFYSFSEKTEQKESSLKKEQIGERIITFLLGSRAELDVDKEFSDKETSEEEMLSSNKETNKEEIPEGIKVSIDGYDVTPELISEEKSEEKAEEQGFFRRFFNLLFG